MSTSSTAEAEQSQLLGSDLVGRFLVLVKVARIHEPQNAAVNSAVRRFRTALDAYQQVSGSEVALQFESDAAFINRQPVPLDEAQWEQTGFLRSFLRDAGLADISFSGMVPEHSVRSLVQALRDLSLDPSRSAEVRARDFVGVKLRDPNPRPSHPGMRIDVDDPLRVLRAYAAVVVSVGRYFEAVDKGATSLLSLRKATQAFARLPERTLPLQLGLLALNDQRQTRTGRAARVSVLSMLMARRVGVRTGLLRDAGTAAALTFLGRRKPFVSAHQIGQPEAIAGFRAMAQNPLQGRGAALAVLAVLDQANAAGRRSGHPLNRIIATADAYDLLTVGSPHGPGLAADEALRKLSFEPDIDPASLQLLTATVGMFPVGTIVRLNDGTIGLVVDATNDPRRILEPRIRVLADSARHSAAGKTLDLAGSPRRIVATIDPRPHGLNVGSLLFGNAGP
ncbi:MAG: hypothetical protein AAGF12_19745 [Myxococcota bacterium]